MEEQKYNGWANYPTWNVALWINNDEGMQFDVLFIAAENKRSPVRAADKIKEFVLDLLEEVGIPSIGMFADILGWALEQVDWLELAHSFIIDAKEAYGEEEDEEETDEE